MSEEKRKPGRPPNQQGNPFKPQQEAEYLSWEHGFNATGKEDCPYDDRDPDARAAYSAWMMGFKANKNRPKVVKATPSESINEIPEPEQALEVAEVGVSLQSLSTAELEAELKKRKIKDLEQLLQQENKLLKALEEVRAKVAKLKVLMGD